MEKVRTALEICQEIRDVADEQVALDRRAWDLKAELEAMTGKSYEEYLGGMAALLEPVEGYVANSLGAEALQAWREQFGGGL
jgi:hypothetical protein